jgi:large subunit ribosomal protein L20
MSAILKSALTWLRPKFAVPNVAAQCLQAVRGMANKRHKKMIKLAKGYRGRANRCFTVAIQRVTKARQYAYRDRKVPFALFSIISFLLQVHHIVITLQVRKRDYRTLWIQRINAATRMYGLPYSVMMSNLTKCDVALNRKILADLAVTEPLSFKSVVEVAKLAKA